MTRLFSKEFPNVSLITNIPRKTVRRWEKPRKPGRVGAGAPTILTPKEEGMIASAMMHANDLGFPQKREDMKVIVETFLSSHNRKNPFKDGKPGNDFCRQFEMRHPELGRQIPELITAARQRGLSKDVLDEFFDKYH